MKFVDWLKENSVELLIGGGAILAAYNYFIEPGYKSGGPLSLPCIGDCGVAVPELYLLSTLMIVMGLMLVYRKRYKN